MMKTKILLGDETVASTWRPGGGVGRESVALRQTAQWPGDWKEALES
jgi:hypothetical protein